MSDLIMTEWLSPGPDMGIGAVLIYDDNDGFKCYIGAQAGGTEDDDAAKIRQGGAKVSVDVAAAFFKAEMINAWLHRNMWGDKGKKRRDFRYDGHDYIMGSGIREV